MLSIYTALCQAACLYSNSKEGRRRRRRKKKGKEKKAEGKECCISWS
ncbi:hypothetical protein PP707_03650 [Acetobacter pasteurianus]|nr:hypothetical protein [Acetobacter pasteurianus]